MTEPKVLIVEDDEAFRYALTRALAAHGILCDEADEAAAAAAKLADGRHIAVILDLALSSASTGYDVLPLAHSGQSQPFVVVVTGVDSLEFERLGSDRVQALFRKPVDVIALAEFVAALVRSRVTEAAPVVA